MTVIEPERVGEAVARLTPSHIAALETLPLPRDADPMRWIAAPARSYSSIWRKSSKHWDAMRALEARGIVERKVSRGERLWRLTKPAGLAVRDYLRTHPANEESRGE